MSKPATADHVVTVGDGLEPEEVVAVARNPAIRVELSEAAADRMAASARRVAAAVERGEPVYGVTTGFGALAHTSVPSHARLTLQRAVLRSHAAGMGDPIDRQVVRAMMLLRARALAMGVSGARPDVARTLIALLNADLVPLVPRHGSLGASGDLAPLAHVGLCLIGEGELLTEDGQRRDALSQLLEHGIAPVELQPKEGLALVNGTDGMLAMLILACDDLARLIRTADVIAAMSIEALLGSPNPFAARIHELRPHPGQAVSADNVWRLLAGSEIVMSHRKPHGVVQDAYSLRCHSQVIGAARDTLTFAVQVVSRELQSAVDNPVIFADGSVEATGNFHGEPLAFASDFLAIAAAEVGAIAERRIDRLLDPTRSAGLPAFLGLEPGLDSGLMIAHYTAAALVAENRRLAVPASTDSMPTSAMQEDHVSMGWAGGCKLRELTTNVSRILAVEALAATHALSFRRPLRPAAATASVANAILEVVPGPASDRFLAPELAAVERLVWSGALLAAAEGAIGQLDASAR